MGVFNYKIAYLKRLSEFQLNAYDRRAMDEPNYMVRLEGYKEADRMLGASLDATLLLLLVHNCCFFINHVCIRHL